MKVNVFSIRQSFFLFFLYYLNNYTILSSNFYIYNRDKI